MYVVVIVVVGKLLVRLGVFFTEQELTHERVEWFLVILTLVLTTKLVTDLDL